MNYNKKEFTMEQLDAAYFELVGTKQKEVSSYCKNNDCYFWFNAPEDKPYINTYDNECPDCIVRKYLKDFAKKKYGK